MEIHVFANGDGVLHVRETAADGSVHRRIIDVGRFENKIWQSTNLDAEPEEVRQAAAKAWTAGVVAARKAQITAMQPPPPSRHDVNIERERRISAGVNVTVDGAGTFMVDSDPVSQRNIQGLGSVATLRVVQGDTTPITFRDATNTDRDLTPAQVLSMAMQVAAKSSAIYAASWAIKALSSIPDDFAADYRWPD